MKVTLQGSYGWNDVKLVAESRSNADYEVDLPLNEVTEILTLQAKFEALQQRLQPLHAALKEAAQAKYEAEKAAKEAAETAAEAGKTLETAEESA